jgi:hypothetical protein
MSQSAKQSKGIFKRLTQGMAATAFSLAVKANNVDPGKDKEYEYQKDTHFAVPVTELEATASQPEEGERGGKNGKDVHDKASTEPLTDHPNHPGGMEGGWGPMR